MVSIIIYHTLNALFVMEDDGARVMNSQFTSLRSEQSAEGYSGVTRPLALFRCANQLRSGNITKLFWHAYESTYSRHVFSHCVVHLKVTPLCS